MGESGTFPFFKKAATEAAEKLEKLGSPRALHFLKEMQDYEALFDSWATHPPQDESKSKTISEFLTRMRSVMEYLSNPND